MSTGVLDGYFEAVTYTFVDDPAVDVTIAQGEAVELTLVDGEPTELTLVDGEATQITFEFPAGTFVEQASFQSFIDQATAAFVSLFTGAAFKPADNTFTGTNTFNGLIEVDRVISTDPQVQTDLLNVRAVGDPNQDPIVQISGGFAAADVPVALLTIRTVDGTMTPTVSKSVVLPGIFFADGKPRPTWVDENFVAGPVRVGDPDDDYDAANKHWTLARVAEVSGGGSSYDDTAVLARLDALEAQVATMNAELLRFVQLRDIGGIDSDGTSVVAAGTPFFGFTMRAGYAVVANFENPGMYLDSNGDAQARRYVTMVAFGPASSWGPSTYQVGSTGDPGASDAQNQTAGTHLWVVEVAGTSHATDVPPGPPVLTMARIGINLAN